MTIFVDEEAPEGDVRRIDSQIQGLKNWIEYARSKNQIPSSLWRCRGWGDPWTMLGRLATRRPVVMRPIGRGSSSQKSESYRSSTSYETPLRTQRSSCSRTVRARWSYVRFTTQATCQTLTPSSALWLLGIHRDTTATQSSCDRFEHLGLAGLSTTTTYSSSAKSIPTQRISSRSPTTWRIDKTPPTKDNSPKRMRRYNALIVFHQT